MRFKHISATMESESKLTAGYQIPHPPPGDEVCITGLSGSFPDSDSVFHLKENLFNKVDLVSGDSRRWKMIHPDIPQRTGKINNLDKFDASYFGLNYKEAHTMDPASRIILERTYEAIIDAGFNPEELRNTKTGVFVGCSISESEKAWFYDKMHVNNYGITGCSLSMIANCISIWLGVQGPSFSLDTACSSSLYAFELAFKAIRSGKCDAAIVGGANLCLHPYMSFQFARLGVLSPDGRCKGFDNSGNGYARSETVGVCFLQKAKDSRKVYAQVIHAKTNCDGYKEQGISYPSGDMQKVLLGEIYEECGILPTSVEYIEAHGTGTKVGDQEELQAIEDVMCTGRSEPLLIGSVKSNLGHSEPGSGICAIAKLCIAYSTGYIPPNMHYKVPRKGIAALVDGRLKVVTKAQPWGRGLSCINNFGFGGANAHVIFKNYEKTKVNNGLPSDDLPRLVCVSGRVYSSVARMLDDMESRTVDIELIRLLHEIHKNNIKGHFYRGYTLLGSTPTKSVSLARSTQYFPGIRRPVCFVYSGIVQENQWAKIASELTRKFPVFASAIERCHETLRPKGINLKQIISKPDSKAYNNVLNSFIGTAVVQIGLTDILKALRIDPDFILGDSVGELGCVYVDGCLTIEQMILAAYNLGLKAMENPFIKGSMATPTVDSLGCNGTAHAGSAIVVRKSLKHNLLAPCDKEYLQAASVMVNTRTGLIALSAVYCPPKHKISEANFTDFFKTLGNRFIAGGDWNAKHIYWGSRLTTSRGRSLKECLHSNHLLTLSTGSPTYWPTDPEKTPDLLDFFITKNVCPQYTSVESSLDGSSDHSPIILRISSIIPTSDRGCESLHNFKTDWYGFRDLLNEEINLHFPMSSVNELEDASLYFTNLVQVAAWKNTPELCTESFSPTLPMVIRHKIEEKRRLRRVWQLSRHPSDKSALNRAIKELKGLLRASANETVRQTLELMSPLGRGERSLWKATKNLNKMQIPIPPIRNRNTWARTDIEKADAFGTYLAAIFKPNEAKGDEDPHIDLILNQDFQLSVPPSPTSPSEVLREIKNMNAKKAPGFDLITPKLLKELPKKCVVFLTNLFNATLRLSHFPNVWKVSQIIMIHKPGKPTHEPSSYRPISLTPVLSKLWEKIFIARLSKCINERDIIPQHQFGFRKHHSTVEQVHRVYDSIRHCLETKQYCSAAFLDIQQAFDKVWHKGLLYKIKKLLPHPIYSTIRSYVENRVFFVKQGEARSGLFKCLAGVPQGSVLGPVLYNIFTHDLPQSADVTIATYADDAAFLSSSVDPIRATAKLQRKLNDTHAWLNKWRMKASAPKSFHITFSLRQGDCPPVIPELKLRPERRVSPDNLTSLSRNHHAKVSSADFHKNYISSVSFEESVRLIPANAIAIEIGPDGILQDLLNCLAKKNVIHIPLTNRTHPDIVQVLFTALGKLYEAGLNPHLANVYPVVEFPVSQGTPMLAHLVEWQHNEDWSVVSYKIINEILLNERTVKISIADEENTYMLGHVIDGRNLFPATGYLVMVWETLGMIMGELYTELSVVFEDVRFHRSTNIHKSGQLEFIVSIQIGSGSFEIVESRTSIVTGRIRVKENVGQEFRLIPTEPESTGPNIKHMLSKDFYKETRLRGYQYSGLFRGVLGCNVEGTRGRLAWINEWVTFLDCMLQMRIIGNDTRGLYVPTRIEKLSIDVKMHNDAVTKMNQEYLRHSFEVRVYPYADVIRAGGVEIRGLHTTPIQKKVSLITPVLEKNIFIPNFGKSTMRIEDILRSNIQLILENIHTYKVKSIEIIDDEYTTKGLEPIMNKVADVLNDLPLIQADLYVKSKNPIEMPSYVNVLKSQLSGQTNTVLLIGANLLERPQILKEALLSLRNEGFIVSREIRPINPKDYSNEYDIIGIQNTGSEYIVLLRKRIGSKPTNFIKIVTSDETYKWIDKVKEGLTVGQKLVIYSQDDQANGLLGLVNCLRREPDGEKIRGLLIADPNAPPFNPDLEFYKNQLDMDLAINVYYEGHWGTYRHLLLKELETIQVYHAFVKTAHIGDLSSQQWLEGPIKENKFLTKSNLIHINVYCAALNFRDVMIASGRIAVDAVANDRLAQECVLGLEVVGRTRNGTRVMAMVANKGLSNIVEADRRVVLFIPDEWTFEEAATVPTAYGTAYYALVMVGKIQKGESILIHAGSGGVGQAAINIALHYGAEVFTTVGTQEKRDFIKRLFPQLKDSHIGNSRDTSFEAMIKEQTNGKGVDLILNSLSDEKLQASIRCLGYGGRFLEIGKFDVNNNTLIDMNSFRNEISFHGIMFDLNMHDTEFAKTLRDLLFSGIETGVVRPLTYCTFEKDEMEKAFRYMAAGKHIGKIVFKIRDEECEDNTDFTKPLIQYIDAVPRYNCDQDLVYIIVGGLGGFGLELADWLILREARKLLLTSRKGVSNGYQSLRLRTWENYGAEVRISTHDITTEKGCEEMLKMANSMGTVAAIFNLAVVLEDRIFQNQTPESFKVSFAPKALVTMNLDKLSQKLCPKLKDFVIFSSVSCGRGNAGQSNYGFSNSVMERICERRKKLGLPALAIQWGAIGDVGLVADMQDDDIEMEIGGTLQQRISSCLLTLDKLLRQDNVIVSSMVVAQKKSSDEGITIAGIVGQVLGIKDIKTVSKQVSLADFGMDSITAVEIKQILERECEIFLTPDGIRSLTFGRLIELTTQSETDDSKTKIVSLTSPEDSAALRVLIRNFGDEKLVEEPFIYLPTMTNNGSDNLSSNQENEMIMFVLPGVEGCASGMANLCRQLKIKVCVLQYCYDEKDDTLDKLVENLFQTIKERLSASRPYILLGYSFGTLLVLKLAQILESEGHSGRVFCIDGSPEFLKELTISKFFSKNDIQLQNRLICYTIDIVAPNNIVTNTLMDELKDIESYDERIKYGIKACPAQEIYSDKFLESVTKAFYNRAKIVLSQNEIKKIKAPIVLIRPKEIPFSGLKETYGLDGFTDSHVTVHLLEENHITIIDSKECADIINSNLSAQGGEKA
ncbi:fatty acid synthase-like [Melitaea cinxia]|uniref:fatty acid synthase-like n=1 Tax=Melitaea cinxia TaxID=113334 RepID=UPI001E274C8D|nr:fatty acid synthase-like [Melitaea cinxia]